MPQQIERQWCGTAEGGLRHLQGLGSSTACGKEGQGNSWQGSEGLPIPQPIGVILT